MAIPYVKNTTWADGSGGATPITAAKLNNVEQGVSDSQLMPAVRAFHNASQSIPNSTLTALAFNSERFDVASGASSTQHDTVTNNSRLTCRFAGKYLIVTNVRFAINASGVREVGIRLNGATMLADEVQTSSGGGTTTILTVTTLYDLAVNDYVETVVNQTSGGALNVEVAANYSPEFMMVRVA